MGIFRKSASIAATDLSTVTSRCELGCLTGITCICTGRDRGERVTISRAMMISIKNNMSAIYGRQAMSTTTR